MEAYLRFIKEVEKLIQINIDTPKDFSRDGMLQCRQRHRENASLCHKPWRRPLMVRQPYSVAVLSTGGRLHP